MAVEARLRVDPVACDAFGHCAELLPELVGLDEWGYPVIDDVPVPAGLLDHVEAAVRACPRKALFVQRVSVARPAPRPDRRVARSVGPAPGVRRIR